MKVKDVHDLDENWQAILFLSHAYVYQNWRFYVDPFVPGFVADVHRATQCLIASIETV